MSCVPKVSALAPWFGSNRTLAAYVGRAMGDCDWVGVPFAGGMCELAHLSARTLVVNDLHRHVINLARIVGHPRLGPTLARRLRRLPFHADALKAAQERCRWQEESGFPVGNWPDEKQLQWATDYFVCAWMGRNGTAGTDGEFCTGLSVRWDAAGGDSVVRFRSATDSLREWRRVLSKATFTTLDVFDFLTKVKHRPGHGIYCDPPFPGPGDGYKHKFSLDDHRRLAATLASFSGCRVICRFYDHPLIRELYPAPEWSWKFLAGRKQTNDSAPEVLLFHGQPMPEG